MRIITYFLAEHRVAPRSEACAPTPVTLRRRPFAVGRQDQAPPAKGRLLGGRSERPVGRRTPACSSLHDHGARRGVFAAQPHNRERLRAGAELEDFGHHVLNAQAHERCRDLGLFGQIARQPPGRKDRFLERGRILPDAPQPEFRFPNFAYFRLSPAECPLRSEPLVTSIAYMVRCSKLSVRRTKAGPLGY